MPASPEIVALLRRRAGAGAPSARPRGRGRRLAGCTRCPEPALDRSRRLARDPRLPGPIDPDSVPSTARRASTPRSDRSPPLAPLRVRHRRSRRLSATEVPPRACGWASTIPTGSWGPGPRRPGRPPSARQDPAVAGPPDAGPEPRPSRRTAGRRGWRPGRWLPPSSPWTTSSCTAATSAAVRPSTTELARLPLGGAGSGRG